MKLRFTLPLKFLCCFATLVCVAGCREVKARRDIQEANKLYYDNRYEEAIKLYEEALAAAPDLKVGWFNLGLAHLALFKEGDKSPPNEAHAKGVIEAFEKYLSFEPNDSEARNYLIGTYIGSGRYDGALDYFKKLLEANPNDLQAINQMATINTTANRFDEAIKWYKRKAEVVTDPAAKADTWYTIGVVDWRRLYQHPEVQGLERARIADEGIGWLMKADETRGNHAPTLSYLNLLYRERAAASDVSYVRAVDSASATVYFKRAVELIKKQ